MTTELTKAAQQALEQLEFLNACYPHKTAADAIASLQSALTQRPAAQTERDTGPRVLREVFALCEDTVDKMTAESTEFSRGRAFEAKGIARAIGTWFQDEYCGQSHMGEPSLPAPQQATPASAPQSLLMRLAGIAAECSDPDTTDALDALIAATQQATPEPLIVKGAMAGMVDAQVRDLWPTKGATPEPVGEVVAWWHVNRLGGIQAFTSEPPPSLKAECRPLVFGDTRPASVVPEGFTAVAYEGPHATQIMQAKQADGSVRWKVQHGGNVLNKDGRWEYEPMPSSRDDAFLARCRYATLAEASAMLAAAQAKGGV